MEWSDIRVFLHVVRQGSMLAATGALRMDHSTVSRRIARLEREAGIQLFERSRRRLALTEEGEKLVVAAEKLESIILREIMSLSGERNRVAGPVRIGTTEEFGAHYLAPRLSALTAAHPDLEIELVALPRAFSLATREVDVVVTLDRPVKGDVRFKKLIDLEFGVYAAPAYFDGRPRPACIEDFAGETWCGYIKELLFSPELEGLQVAPAAIPVRYRTTSTTVQLGAALGGHALATLPCFVAAEHPALERLLPFEAILERTYWLAVHEDLAGHPRVRALMGAIEALVAEDRARFRPTAASIVEVVSRPVTPLRSFGIRGAAPRDLRADGVASA
jgi:DNA-binding transcriptional LysR family regulator